MRINGKQERDRVVVGGRLWRSKEDEDQRKFPPAWIDKHCFGVETERGDAEAEFTERGNETGST